MTRFLIELDEVIQALQVEALGIAKEGRLGTADEGLFRAKQILESLAAPVSGQGHDDGKNHLDIALTDHEMQRLMDMTPVNAGDAPEFWREKLLAPAVSPPNDGGNRHCVDELCRCGWKGYASSVFPGLCGSCHHQWSVTDDPDYDPDIAIGETPADLRRQFLRETL